jgi:hypothetical protein
MHCCTPAYIAGIFFLARLGELLRINSPQGLDPSLPETDKNTDIECARSRKACLNERREKYHCVNVMAPKKNETKSSR